MQEAVQDIGLVVFQAAVILSLILMIVGLLRPGWFLFWLKEPKPFYMFVISAVLFLVSYFGFGIKAGTPWPIAAIHAVILFSVLFLVVGLINPAWVFGRPVDRLWVIMIAAALFMGFMTLQGMYYGPKGKRRHPLPTETKPQPPAQAVPQPGETAAPTEPQSRPAAETSRPEGSAP